MNIAKTNQIHHKKHNCHNIPLLASSWRTCFNFSSEFVCSEIRNDIVFTQSTQIKNLHTLIRCHKCDNGFLGIQFRYVHLNINDTLLIVKVKKTRKARDEIKKVSEVLYRENS
jgi:hypothetical protein